MKEKLDADEMLAAILGLGDESFKSVLNLSRSGILPSVSLSPSFTQVKTPRVAKAAMMSKFCSVWWKPSGVFCIPTLVKRLPSSFHDASARRGGRGRARRGGIAGRALLQQITREEEKEEEGGDSDSSVSSDLGPMFDLNL